MTREDSAGLRILFLAPQPFFAPRGTPIAIRAALEVLAEEGHEIDVLTYFEGEDVEIPRVTIHRIRRPPLVRSVPIGLSWQKILCDLYMLLNARRVLAGKNSGYDVMHGVEEGAVLAWYLSRRTGIPYVFDMDSHISAQIAQTSVLLRPLSRLVVPVEAAALRGAVGVLAVCPALADVAREYRNPGRVSVLPDMPLNDGENDRPSKEIESLGGTRIVYVGNLQTYQGIDLLLEAFGMIAPEHPDARLVVVGGSPKQIAEYSDAAGALVDEGRVHFVGPRPLEQLGSILAAADILASPRLEGINTPMKIYSYLESGRAVVATRLRTHTQVLSDEVACLVEPDAGSFADGLSRLLADPGLRQELGARGREFVRAEFGRDRFRRRLGTFYGDIGDRIRDAGTARRRSNERPGMTERG